MSPEPVAAPFVALIPLAPLAGALVLGLGGAAIQRRAGRGVVGALACATVGVAFVGAVVAFVRLAALPPDARLLLADGWSWIASGTFAVRAALTVDPLTAVMLLVVTGVGGLIHVYATGYMHDDPHAWRFFAYLNLFTFAMLVLVLADNLLLLFLGWEGVGFCSWALIGFWHRDAANVRAGNKAFIANRVGDCGFVLGLFLLFWSFDAAGVPTLTFRTMAAHQDALAGMQVWGVPVATLATLLLFLGATGKSAQIPLYVWLPDAMAGPTPVSALIHAATMVTAGVYMVGRLHWLFAQAPFTLHVIAVVGAATALVAATIALVQDDVKKVLAYSTVSQLGYMFLAMGVGAYGAGIFHLVTHAFFKAGLFLAAGSVIHGMDGEQDMRKMGGLARRMPQTFATWIVFALALAGCPFLAGFFSKDEILWQAFSSRHGHWALWLVGTMVAGLTAFYTFRQVFLIFAGECRADASKQHHLHESPAVMTIPLWLLAAGAIGAGYLGVPEALGDPTGIPHLVDAWLAPVLGGPHATVAGPPHHAPHLALVLMAVSVGVAGTGVLVAWLAYGRGVLHPAAWRAAFGGVPYRVLRAGYGVDAFYQAVFVRGTIGLGRVLAWIDGRVIDGIVHAAAAIVRGASQVGGWVDRTIVDGVVDGVADGAWAAGARLRRLQSGAINAYLYVVVLGVLGGVLLYWTWAAAG